MIKTPEIKKEYDGRVVLDVPEINFEEGKIYALVGANGSGKSTFGRFCGLAYQPQKPYIFRMSVKKNIMLAGKDKIKLNGLLKKLNLESLANARADKISGGEAAKMALARSIMANKKAIVLDEPTSAMDMHSSKLAEEVIRRYADDGNVVILITHSIRQAKRISDRLIFLKDGMINTSKKDLKEFLDYYE